MAVSKEVSAQEIENWLNLKRVKPSQREVNKDNIETLIEGIQDGTLTMAEDGTITHELLFPLQDKDGNDALSKLTYRPRLNDVMLRPHLVGVKPTDGDARIVAYMAALTGQLKALLEKLDTADKRIALAVTSFFF